MTHDHTNHHPAEEVPEADESQAPSAAEAEPLVAPREEQTPEPAVPDGSGTPQAVADDDLAARAAKADEYLALAQRKQAEFENFRKRASREAAQATQRGAAKLAADLLPAIDNLERALQHAPDDADTPDGAQVTTALVAGVRHVHSDLIAALQRAGIEQYSPEGEAFDPTQHEAIAQQPIEGAQPGTVVEVYQRGYRAGETVVRPARVVVAG